jgi:flagellar biosynthesis GTPase FlhF
MEFMTDNKTKSNSKLGVSKSGRKRMNKKEASKWFQTLTRLERSLLKQEKNSSSSSSSSSDEGKKIKKEMHERERELLLKRRSEHEARMKAQLQSKAEITKQIQKCKDMRSQLIPHQMRLAQMQLHQSHAYHDYTRSAHFYFKLGMLDCGISNQLRLIQNEEKVLFDMQHKHHCTKKSIKDIIAKRTTHSNPYTKVQAKNYVDDVLGV